MDVPVWVWLVTVGAIGVLFALDLAIVDRKPHEVGMAEAVMARREGSENVIRILNLRYLFRQIAKSRQQLRSPFVQARECIRRKSVLVLRVAHAAAHANLLRHL